ncbi:MAG: bacteriocin [Clostridioides sp.]|nr:bacteriocin [Clostridioides sp.]
MSQGIFAVLFCLLLLYVLKENNARENTYQKLIQDLTSFLPTIKEDVSIIKNSLEKTQD